jgi:hypothetical protein
MDRRSATARSGTRSREDIKLAGSIGAASIAVDEPVAALASDLRSGSGLGG